MDTTRVAALQWSSKEPGATLDYYVGFEKECARVWEPFTDFSSGDRIRVYVPGRASGFEFLATAGRTAGRMPAWPSTIDNTVQDGSITWTCKALSTASLRRTISGTPVWSADTGVTISGAAVAGQVAYALISGGADGEDYSVTVTATLSDGVIVPVVVVLPVRRSS